MAKKQKNKQNKQNKQTQKYDYKKLMNLHNALKYNDPCSQIDPNEIPNDIIGVTDDDRQVGFACGKDNEKFKFMGLIQKDKKFLTFDDIMYEKIKTKKL